MLAGWEPVEESEAGRSGFTRAWLRGGERTVGPPDYLGSMTRAWDLVTRAEQGGWALLLAKRGPSRWVCEFAYHGQRARAYGPPKRLAQGFGSTPSEAICRAFIAIVDRGETGPETE